MIKNGNYNELPSGYRELFHLKLQEDKKTALIVNIAALVVASAMVVIPIFMGVDVFSFLDNGSFEFFIKLIAMLICYGIYIYAHEITHGIFIKIMSGQKAYYGFTGIYAYAGSDIYFNKRSYTIIALAPLCVFGIILTVLQLIVPDGWGYVPYLVQIGNVAGAVGDVYVTIKMLASPKGTIVRDTGINMTFYADECYLKRKIS